MPRWIERRYDELTPSQRRAVRYENNGSWDVAEPQGVLTALLDDHDAIRWDMGVTFFRMADILAAERHPDITASTGDYRTMGSAVPLIPLHLDGDEHRRYRKLIDPLLTPRRMEAMQPRVVAVADELIDRFAARGRAELFHEFCDPLASRVFISLFGLPEDDLAFLLEMKDGILKNAAPDYEQHCVISLEVGQQMREFLRTRVEERIAAGAADEAEPDDLIGAFLSFEVDGDRLTVDDILNIVQLFTIAGLDTVSSSLSCILAWLARHPEERRALVANPAAIAPAIEELMRFESPVSMSGGRVATADCDVNGIPVRKGDLISSCWATANIDPEAFPRPLTVDLGREENRHIAFAAGIHRCLGSHLARTELRTAIAQFHRRIPDYEIDPDRELVYSNPAVRSAVSLPVTFAPAQRS